jgi:hypothetical protein
MLINGQFNQIQLVLELYHCKLRSPVCDHSLRCALSLLLRPHHRWDIEWTRLKLSESWWIKSDSVLDESMRTIAMSPIVDDVHKRGMKRASRDGSRRGAKIKIKISGA